MPRTRARPPLVLLALLVALFATAAAPATAAISPKPQPVSDNPAGPGIPPRFSLESCADYRALVPFAPDGTYPVRAGNTVLTVFCYDMAGTPREYIDLPATAENTNFSQYTAGGASPGTDVRTSFTRLRIDPATLTVDIGDLTFATSTGELQHSAVTRGPGSPVVTSMPFGAAMSCTSRPDGVADITLHATPFIVDDTFATSGFAARGTATISADKQTVHITGGGYCGWNGPAPAMGHPFNPQPGDFRLNLACAPADAQPVRAATYCIALS